MAVTTRTPRTVRRPRPSHNWELHAWYFTRVTGLFLVVLALTHWTIMHFLNRLSVEDSAWIIARYQNVFWPTFDATMLLFAMLHGANGARVIIDDYVHSRAWNVVWKGILFGATFIFIALGLITIFMLPHTKVQ